MSSFPVLRTRLSVCFLSPFPDSLPQLFLRCLPCALAFGLSPFLPLSFVCFRSGSGYLALCFFLSSFFPSPPHSGFLGAPFRSRFFGFPRSFRPDFSCLLSRFFVLGFLFVSFRPSLIRSHSCSSGAYLVLSLSVFSPAGPLPFVRFTFGSGYLASVSSFPLSSRLCLTVASSVLPLYLSASLLFPVPSDLISHVLSPGSSYSAFCLFPFTLP